MLKITSLPAPDLCTADLFYLILITENSMSAYTAYPRVRSLVQSDGPERRFPLVLRASVQPPADVPSFEPDWEFIYVGTLAAVRKCFRNGPAD